MEGKKIFGFLTQLWLGEVEELRRLGSWCLAALPQHQGSPASLAGFVTWLEELLAIPALRTQGSGLEARLSALEAGNRKQAAIIADLQKRVEVLEQPVRALQPPAVGAAQAPKKRPWE